MFATLVCFLLCTIRKYIPFWTPIVYLLMNTNVENTHPAITCGRLIDKQTRLKMPDYLQKDAHIQLCVYNTCASERVRVVSMHTLPSNWIIFFKLSTKLYLLLVTYFTCFLFPIVILDVSNLAWVFQTFVFTPKPTVFLQWRKSKPTDSGKT